MNDYTVFFYNFGYTKHFNSLEEALTYGKESGFECAVVDKDGNQVKVFKTIQCLTFSEECGSLLEQNRGPVRTESALVIYKCNKDTEKYFIPNTSPQPLWPLTFRGYTL